MALTEEERRRLAQLEADLAADDPKFANALRGSGHRWARRQTVLAALLFFLGLGALVGGMEVHWLVSVLGFVIMLGAAVLALRGFEQAEAAAGASDRAHDGDRSNERHRHQSGDST
jgi:Protein of unknown function (DUF3040).